MFVSDKRQSQGLQEKYKGYVSHTSTDLLNHLPSIRLLSSLLLSGLDTC